MSTAQEDVRIKINISRKRNLSFEAGTQSPQGAKGGGSRRRRRVPPWTLPAREVKRGSRNPRAPQKKGPPRFLQPRGYQVSPGWAFGKIFSTSHSLGEQKSTRVRGLFSERDPLARLVACTRVPALSPSPPSPAKQTTGSPCPAKQHAVLVLTHAPLYTLANAFHFTASALKTTTLTSLVAPVRGLFVLVGLGLTAPIHGSQSHCCSNSSSSHGGRRPSWSSWSSSFAYVRSCNPWNQRARCRTCSSSGKHARVDGHDRTAHIAR